MNKYFFHKKCLHLKCLSASCMFYRWNIVGSVKQNLSVLSWFIWLFWSLY